MIADCLLDGNGHFPIEGHQITDFTVVSFETPPLTIKERIVFSARLARLQKFCLRHLLFNNKPEIMQNAAKISVVSVDPKLLCAIILLQMLTATQ